MVTVESVRPAAWGSQPTVDIGCCGSKLDSRGTGPLRVEIATVLGVAVQDPINEGDGAADGEMAEPKCSFKHGS